ncbi:MAG: cytochrome c oxidase subunit II [Planctomycetota bacterium]
MIGLMIHAVLPSLSMQEPQGKPEFEPIGWSSQLPPAASSFCSTHDPLFYFTYYMCVFFFIVITGVLVYSVIRYRRRYEGQPPASMVTHHTALEVTWTVVPLILVMIIFAWGFAGALDMSKAPEDALTYQVVGKQWSWDIKHPPGDSALDIKTNEFWVPIDTNVLMTTRSDDVLHSLFLPAMRTKRDVLPGRYQTVWFRPTRLGTYPFFCAEYCGLGHSDMNGRFHVVSQEDFAKRPWRVLPDDPVAAGKIFYEKCKSCHSVDGSTILGPSFKDLYGSQEDILDTKTKKYINIKVDDKYILESIREPQKLLVKGYETEIMTPFSETQLPKEYIEKYLIPYLKSISKHVKDNDK